MRAKLGQNFLADKNILQKIANVIPTDRPVIEIGTGEAALTLVLAEKIQENIQSYEIDHKVYNHAVHLLKDYTHVNVTNIDFLKAELKLSHPHVVIANIPYYITSPIIDKCLNEPAIVDIYLMVQKEIAERIIAKEGEKNYSSFSIFCQTRSHVKRLFNVSKNCFNPKPKVDSSFISLCPHNHYLNQIDDITIYNVIIKSAFWGKRKTLINCLNKAPYISIDKNVLVESFNTIGLDLSIRGECVSIDQFIKLANLINKNKLASS